MFKILGFTLYMTDIWPFAYAILYFPLALWVLSLARKHWLYSISNPRARKSTTWLVATLILTFPLWDVLVISIKANHLCRTQGGIHVFKTAQADSVLVGNIAALAPHGFKFTEDVGAGGNKFRYRLQNGKVVEEPIESFTARYRNGGGEFQALDNRFAKTVYKLIDTTNDEVLSNLVTFSIYPGLFDAIVLSTLGGSTHWICGNEPSPGRTRQLFYEDLDIRH